MSTHHIGRLSNKPKCPKCGHTLNGYGRLDDAAKPQPGDFTVCIGCVTPLEFTFGLALLPMTEARLESLAPDELRDLWNHIGAVEAMRKQARR